jgi:sigma-B regulation protein RsbU (phosphoserine phosphatase)
MGPHSQPRLTDLFDAETLRVFQDRVADITRLPTAICDAEGRPVIGPSGPPRLLSILQSSDVARHRVAAVLARLARDPAATAHADLAFLAATIRCDDARIGCIVVGGLPRTAPDAALIERVAADLALPRGARAKLQSVLIPWPPGARAKTTTLVQLMADLLTQLAATARTLRTRQEQIGTVHGVADMVSGTHDQDDVLGSIAQQVCDTLNVKACSIRLHDRASGEMRIKAVHNLSDAYLNKGAVLLSENPIDRAAMNGEVVYVEDAGNDPRSRFPAEARAEGIVSGLSVGMTYRGQAVGVLRVYADRRYRFATAETALLRSFASQAASVIVNSRLYLEAVDARRYRRQLAYAGAIQRRMIPEPPDNDHIELASVYEPTSNVGGDFFDFFDFRDSDQLGICVADVVGKGIPAALMMASLRTAFRLYLYATQDVTEAMTMTNLHMCNETLVSEFATLFCGIFEEEGQKLTFCNAGHDPPLLCRDGVIETLSHNNFIIGVLPNECYSKHTVALQPGDALLFYTDGLIDAVNFENEAFGRQRLAKSFGRVAGESAEQVARGIMWDVRRFIGLADQADDMTLVVARVK